MEPEKLAVASITLIVVVIGMFVGVSFLTFPPDELTRTTEDTDLLELGLEVPDSWIFEMSDETTLTLSDLEGQVVLVDLMATWCGTCADQNEDLEIIHEDLASTVVVVSLTVDEDETTSMMAEYMTSKDITWAHGVDDRQFMDYFSISYLPTIVLIDADGFFRYFHVGPWDASRISSTIASIS